MIILAQNPYGKKFNGKSAFLVVFGGLILFLVIRYGYSLNRGVDNTNIVSPTNTAKINLAPKITTQLWSLYEVILTNDSYKIYVEISNVGDASGIGAFQLLENGQIVSEQTISLSPRAREGNTIEYVSRLNVIKKN